MKQQATYKIKFKNLKMLLFFPNAIFISYYITMMFSNRIQSIVYGILEEDLLHPISKFV